MTLTLHLRKSGRTRFVVVMMLEQRYGPRRLHRTDVDASVCVCVHQCRSCGPPRLCNPVDQMSVGQATILVGLVEITMLEYVPDHDSSSPHAWSVVWSGALVRNNAIGCCIFYDQLSGVYYS